MTFESVHHPGTLRRPALTIRAQARFVGWILLVVMVAGLAAALSGRDILWPALWSVAGGYTLAVVAAQWWLHETTAEIEIRGALVVVRSVWDAADGPRRDETLPVFEARLRAGELHVSLGDRVETFRRSDWPQFDALVEGFRAAAVAAQPEPVDR